ncbi:hypothetical protein JE592_002483 [Salmonella enterica]|nr:hypothetical protein [Salmonella enterica]
MHSDASVLPFVEDNDSPTGLLDKILESDGAHPQVNPYHMLIGRIIAVDDTGTSVAFSNTTSKALSVCPLERKDKGQTGHHLIPGASIADACKNYDHSVAPVVCAEGTSWNLGSHGRAHNAYAKAIATKPKDSSGTVSLDDAITAAVQSHMLAFPLSKCSPKCIRAQLESYYKQMCKGARPNVVNEQGKSTNSTEEHL